MPCRKTKRAVRKKREEEKTPVDNKEDLKKKLREKLRIAKLGRLSQAARDNMMEKLEEKLEDASSTKERTRIKKEIDILNEIEDRQQKSHNDDFPEYGDNANYGGGMEN